MSTPKDDQAEAGKDGRPHAKHGDRNEVSWDGGKGRQPYANQEESAQDNEAGQPAGWPETEGGNRGEASGRTLEQMEEVRRKP